MIKSSTYKLKTPLHEEAIYFTIVGNPPIHLFVNSKAMESFQWITLSMSAMTMSLRKGVCIDEVIKAMKETFDPNGAYVIPDGTGRKVPSLVHHLGLVLEGHMNEIQTEEDSTSD